MAFWAYILRCADDSYYTGHTDNLEARLYQHNEGTIVSCYTYKRRPLELVFSQDFPTREEALAAEQQIKGWSRKKKEAMMRGDWAEVSRLAKSKSPFPAPPTTTVRLNGELAEFIKGQAHDDRNTQTVRPELVEGQFTEASQSSIHPSTGSGRTDDESTVVFLNIKASV